MQQQFSYMQEERKGSKENRGGREVSKKELEEAITKRHKNLKAFQLAISSVWEDDFMSDTTRPEGIACDGKMSVAIVSIFLDSP